MIISLLGLGIMHYLNVRKKVFTVAVLTYDESFFNNVVSGLLQDAPEGIEFKFYYGQGMDKIFMQAALEQALMIEPDAIMPIGVSFSQLCVHTMAKRSKRIPIIFAGPGKPLEQGLVTTLEARPEPVTGISLSPIDYHQPARILLAGKKVKEILIPYSPFAAAGELEKVACDLVFFFKEYNVVAHALPVPNFSDIKPLLAPFLPHVDVVMCLESDGIDMVNDLLVKLCNEHNVLLFVKDLECVRGGAPLGFGVEAKVIGRAAARVAELILVRGIYAGRIPVQSIDGVRRLAFNKETAQEQGVDIDAITLFCAHNNIVIAK